MDGRCGLSSVAPLISATIGWSIRSSCLFGRYSATVIKISRPGCGCDAWLAHARRRALLRVGSGRLRMLSLSGYRRGMSLTRHPPRPPPTNKHKKEETKKEPPPRRHSGPTTNKKKKKKKPPPPPPTPNRLES